MCVLVQNYASFDLLVSTTECVSLTKKLTILVFGAGKCCYHGVAFLVVDIKRLVLVTCIGCLDAVFPVPIVKNHFYHMSLKKDYF